MRQLRNITPKNLSSKRFGFSTNNLKKAKEKNRALRNMKKVLKAKNNPDSYSVDFPVCWMCFDKETKLLTENGWKFFPELKQGEKVVTLNPKTNEIEYHIPDQLISYHYKGKLYALESRMLSLRVIPNHNLYVRLPGEEKFSLRKAKEVFHKTMEMKTDAIWRSEKRLNPELLKLLGYYISEGSISKYQTKIAQQKGEKRELIKLTLERLGLKYGEDNLNLWFHDQTIEKMLLKAGKEASNKRIPREIFKLNSKDLKILLDALMLGDGNFTRTKGRKGNRVYITSSYQLAEDIQELLLKTGSSGKIGTMKGGLRHFENGDYITKDCYRIVERCKNLTPQINDKKKNDQWIDYSDMVYSVNVKNHIIYVKHNEKPVWSGNCWMDLTEENLDNWRKEPFSSAIPHGETCSLCGYSHWKGRAWFPFRFLQDYIGNPSSRYF